MQFNYNKKRYSFSEVATFCQEQGLRLIKSASGLYELAGNTFKRLVDLVHHLHQVLEAAGETETEETEEEAVNTPNIYREWTADIPEGAWVSTPYQPICQIYRRLDYGNYTKYVAIYKGDRHPTELIVEREQFEVEQQAVEESTEQERRESENFVFVTDDSHQFEIAMSTEIKEQSHDGLRCFLVTSAGAAGFGVTEDEITKEGAKAKLWKHCVGYDVAINQKGRVTVNGRQKSNLMVALQAIDDEIEAYLDMASEG